MANLLIEIGSEEIPSSFQAKETGALKESFERLMKEAGLEYENVTVMATPRRLVLLADGIADMQRMQEEVITGPSLKVAFSENGEPTKALIGFCNSNGITLADIYTTTTKKGDYVAFTKKCGGLNAREVLEKIIPQLITTLPFPKSMKWGNHDLAYARPIRWLVALLDDQVIPVAIDSITAGRMTYGHRIHASGPIAIPHAKEYLSLVTEQGKVTIDQQERINTIIANGNELAKNKNGEVVWSKELLEEVGGLVEHPVAILGDFDETYLEIPEQVLLTSMESHQKSFGIRGKDGKLLPHFLSTLNLEPLDFSEVKKGWEKVLRARLEDARFFWHEDKSKTQNQRQKALEKVIFIGPLGSMADKSERLKNLCGWLASETGLVNSKDAERAGELAKNDLVSSMVGEFDTLQGIMGGIYAKLSGENETVALAIQEQYLPAGPESPLPATVAGSLLSIADKADTLSGCFGLGMIPTGTADPNGLRRCALGILRIYLSLNLKLPLQALFQKALSLYGDKKWKMPKEDIIEKLNEFLNARLRGVYLSEGFSTQLVEAVLTRSMKNPVESKKRLEALSRLSHDSDFIPLMQILKRIENITKKEMAISGSWDKKFLIEPAEKKLALSLENILPEIDDGLNNENFDKVFEGLRQLKEPINEFFENVMVNCEDKSLRENRIKLLKDIHERFAKIADYSQLQI